MAIQHYRILRLYRIETVFMETFPVNLGGEKSILPYLDRLSRYDSRIERQLRVLHNRYISLYKQRESRLPKCFTFKE